MVYFRISIGRLHRPVSFEVTGVCNLLVFLRNRSNRLSQLEAIPAVLPSVP
jgi:hypothetical protein